MTSEELAKDAEWLLGVHPLPLAIKGYQSTDRKYWEMSSADIERLHAIATRLTALAAENAKLREASAKLNANLINCLAVVRNHYPSSAVAGTVADANAALATYAALAHED